MTTVITTINSSDLITNSRTDINNNFSSLNTNKIETSVIDTDGTLAANSDTNLPSQKAVKTYVDTGGNVNASTTVKGIVEEATAAEILAGTAAGGTAARLFVNPSTLNTYIYPTFINLITFGSNANGYGFFSDDPQVYISTPSTTSFNLIDIRNGYFATRTVTSEWASATYGVSYVVLGLYVYVLMANTTPNPDQFQVWRYLKSDLTSSPTQMTFSGQALTAANVDIQMSCDGTNFYFNFQAGNSASGHIISKYTLSGTAFTYVSSTTCGATAANFYRYQVRSDGQYIGMNNADVKTRRYNTSGTLQATSIAFSQEYQYFTSIAGVAFYMGDDNAGAGTTLTRIPIV